MAKLLGFSFIFHVSSLLESVTSERSSAAMEETEMFDSESQFSHCIQTASMRELCVLLTFLVSQKNGGRSGQRVEESL